MLNYREPQYGSKNILVHYKWICKNDAVMWKKKVLPHQLLVKSMLEEDTFPEDWKKSNVVPVHKKVSANLIKIIVKLVFFLFSPKYLKSLHSILCLITLCKTNLLQSVSQVSYLVTHALSHIMRRSHTWWLMRWTIAVNYTWTL